MKHLLGALLLAGVLPAAAAPLRVASVSLCTDLLLLETAAPAQIASLTWLASDPSLSPFAARARQFPVNHGHVEEMLALAPDLVLTDDVTPARTRDLLSRLGLRVEIVPLAHTPAAIREALSRVAVLLGREAENSQLLQAFERLGPAPARATPASAWVVQPGGHTPGQPSVANALLEAAALDNAAARAGYAQGGFVALEKLVAAAPRFLLVPPPTPGGFSLGARYLDHPALRHASRDGRLSPVALRESDWTCGSSAFLDAARTLRTAAP